MSNKRYTEEFKIAAVQQVIDRGYSVAEVAHRLGVTAHSLYAWNSEDIEAWVTEKIEGVEKST